MKAWLVRDCTDDDKGTEIVFAKDHKSAVMAGYCTHIDFDSYIDVRVRRYKEFDGLENLDEREMSLKKWRDNWWFEERAYPDCETASDEEFYRWYDKNLK